MPKLYLLRHGIALPHSTPGMSDDDRPLTPKGESRIGRIADGLRLVGVAPDRIVTSPLPRARRTAEIVAIVLGLEESLENADALRPGVSAEEIRDWLRTRSEARMMLVGHNPNLSELLGLLVGLGGDPPPFELKKGGFAALRTADRERYQIQWLSTPRLIRKLM